MKDIFQTNGRIEQKDGMHFYENDVVMLDYIYDGDLIINIELEYNFSGFALILSSYNENLKVSDEPTQSYIFKIGSYDFAVYKKEFREQKRIAFSSSHIIPDKKSHYIRFRKTGYYMYMYEIVNNQDVLIGYHNLKTTFGKFYLGLYSNKGNTITSMEILDNRPQFWFTNIQNTNGGRASFATNTFKVENAEHDIEVEQEKIFLNAGTYYLSYDAVPVNDNLDEKAFVFDSREDKIHAPEKTFLEPIDVHLPSMSEYAKNYKLKVPEDMNVNILFQVNSGQIKNIAIKDDYRESYISTDEHGTTKDGSYILVHLDGLIKVEWSGTIEMIPEYLLTEAPPYSVYEYSLFKYTIEMAGIKVGTYYNYTFTYDSGLWQMKITDETNNNIFYCEYFPSSDNLLTVFKNIYGFIDRFIITYENGTEIDVLHQRTMKKYVPISIKSPILVTDGEGNPFDLSASFRKTDNDKYVFTNWEREIFGPVSKLLLNSKVNGNTNIILYGLYEETDFEKLYNVKDNTMITSIEKITTKYDSITADFYEIIDDQMLVLAQEIQDKEYAGYIVDYLKADSYAINVTEDKTQYEVDISSYQDVIYLMYDMTENGQIREYKSIDRFLPQDDRYIILRKNEVIL